MALKHGSMNPKDGTMTSEHHAVLSKHGAMSIAREVTRLGDDAVVLSRNAKTQMLHGSIDKRDSSNLYSDAISSWTLSESLFVKIGKNGGLVKARAAVVQGTCPGTPTSYRTSRIDSSSMYSYE